MNGIGGSGTGNGGSGPGLDGRGLGSRTDLSGSVRFTGESGSLNLFDSKFSIKNIDRSIQPHYGDAPIHDLENSCTSSTTLVNPIRTFASSNGRTQCCIRISVVNCTFRLKLRSSSSGFTLNSHLVS